MSTKMIKRLILWTPAVTIGIWEYVRHAFLLPYISMDMGNILAPIIVFIISMTLLAKLFRIMEDTEQKLYEEKRSKALLEERERLAQELHDGISQSLFMLAVKVDRLQRAPEGEREQQLTRLQGAVHHVHDNVRQAIENLHMKPEETEATWVELFMQMIEDIKAEAEWEPRVEWQLDDEEMTMKEKLTLFSCVREALTNISKHAHATEVQVCAATIDDGFECRIVDNGVGITEDPFQLPGKYGLKMMRDRVHNMGWTLSLYREKNRTIVAIRGG